MITRATLVFKGCIGCGVLAWASVGAVGHAIGAVGSPTALALGFGTGAAIGGMWGFLIPLGR